MKVTEAMKRASVEWNKMSTEEKAPFVKLGEEDKQRFQRQKQEEIDNGFFIMDDGKKSCDVAGKAKKKVTDPKSKMPKMKDRAIQTTRIVEPTKRDRGV